MDILGFDEFLHVLFAPDSFLQPFSSCEGEAAIKRIVNEQEHTEKIQIVIADWNRSLFFTQLNHTLIAGPWRISSLYVHDEKRPRDRRSNY